MSITKPANQENILKSHPYVLKTVINSIGAIISNKIKDTKNSVFSKLISRFSSISSVADKVNSDLKFKGKMLMGLKEYPRYNLKRSFWRWYLSATGTG